MATKTLEGILRENSDMHDSDKSKKSDQRPGKYQRQYEEYREAYDAFKRDVENSLVLKQLLMGQSGRSSVLSDISDTMGLYKSSLFGKSQLGSKIFNIFVAEGKKNKRNEASKEEIEESEELIVRLREEANSQELAVASKLSKRNDAKRKILEAVPEKLEKATRKKVIDLLKYADSDRKKAKEEIGNVGKKGLQGILTRLAKGRFAAGISNLPEKRKAVLRARKER